MLLYFSVLYLQTLVNDKTKSFIGVFLYYFYISEESERDRKRNNE